MEISLQFVFCGFIFQHRISVQFNGSDPTFMHSTLGLVYILNKVIRVEILYVVKKTKIYKLEE